MRKLRICILGFRGFPNVQGGVEKRVEEIATRIANNEDCEIIVLARKSYFPVERRSKEYKKVKFYYLFAPRNKYLEAVIHTFLGVIFAKFLNPDILHFQSIGPSLFVPLAKVLGFKVVITHHGPDYLREKWKGLSKTILKLGEFFAIKSADKIIVVSQYIKSYLEKKYGRKDIIVIPNGIEIPKISQNTGVIKKFGLQPKKYVFTACRFVPEKGLHNLISAYRKIKNPEFKLVIAGDADHETKYSRNLKKLANETQGVVLTGVLTGEPLAELYSNAGLFVLPSYYEGLPIALLEALSYGLPVLVSDIPQHREIPLSEFRYFKVNDVDELAKKIVELYNLGISDEEKQKYLELLKEHYNWDKITKDVFEVYKSLVAR